ncbi:MAG TPA: adenylosuccinate lyase [Oscillospiraceae bacterium]|nr:adenylosuccinate lyase [Oscillospiraceae bacterium]HRW57668.1 adenylosuccinate lyase [Oscillospiraceae bacterium]
MTDMHDFYESPLEHRYAGEEMQRNFSDQKKFSTWRRLWLALAEAEQTLGLPITDLQLNEMRAHLDDINFEDAEAIEAQIRHDVMSHVQAFGMQCPEAKPILHLGATSCYVGDNADLIIMRDGLEILKKKLVNVIALLSDFAEKEKDLPCLAYTHCQPAQLTTVGKRACLWAQDFAEDYDVISEAIGKMKLRGAKGTTGTQASFLELFGGDTCKVKTLDSMIAEKMGFEKTFSVTGQTYPRKQDYRVLTAVAGIAQSAHKFTNDIRLLQSFGEIYEPFGGKQVGSSAMAYKQNPMRSERCAGLSRYLTNLVLNPAETASEQWFERTLDDSSNRRLAISESFLTADGILNLVANIAGGLRVFPKVIAVRVRRELPFMATENILMDAVKQGGDRQELHEAIREYSMEAFRRIREEGEENNLLDVLAADGRFGLDEESLKANLIPERYTGLAAKQTEDYVAELRETIIEPNRGLLGIKDEVKL